MPQAKTAGWNIPRHGRAGPPWGFNADTIVGRGKMFATFWPSADKRQVLVMAREESPHAWHFAWEGAELFRPGRAVA